jgi:uncharacterized membrane protein
MANIILPATIPKISFIPIVSKINLDVTNNFPNLVPEMNLQMTPVLYILVYLIGCVIGYIMFRADFKKSVGVWTVGDRFAGIVLSILSWITVIVGILIIWEDSFDTNKPAKW